MSEQNHEARIAELERAVVSALVREQMSQKTTLFLIQAILKERTGSLGILNLMIRINPELRTDEIAGGIHSDLTKIEFDLESVSEFLSRLPPSQPPLPPES